MELIEVFLSATITILALGMLCVSFLSFRSFKNVKLLFVSGAFLIFFIKGVVLSLVLFYPDVFPVSLGIMTGFADVLILVVLFLATLKR